MLLDTSQSIGFQPAMFGLSAWTLNTLTVVSTNEKARTPKAQTQKSLGSRRRFIRDHPLVTAGAPFVPAKPTPSRPDRRVPPDDC
ncbi:MAG: hypothetical protein P0Y50_13595 [Candidatus Brevundimonas colombiensis]|uniref:Uncharacterized protein n=1 Tax=Candidatus Brevundimonas colombiensis TaxID=3121376 RepID=A0AAJ5X1R5_9CAUL|nr:hypothetical protein [Brevundimonas sp.]WEK39557.1 MAG: hypothetical protein P0Y50_13595 [Brevundimonas sp.]